MIRDRHRALVAGDRRPPPPSPSRRTRRAAPSPVARCGAPPALQSISATSDRRDHQVAERQRGARERQRDDGRRDRMRTPHGHAARRRRPRARRRAGRAARSPCARVATCRAAAPRAPAAIASAVQSRSARRGTKPSVALHSPRLFLLKAEPDASSRPRQKGSFGGRRGALRPRWCGAAPLPKRRISDGNRALQTRPHGLPAAQGRRSPSGSSCSAACSRRPRR